MDLDDAIPPGGPRASPRSRRRRPPWPLHLTATLALILLAASPAPTERAPAPADILIFGGPVHTVDPDLGQTSALAIRGRRIVWVGDDDEVSRWRGPDTLAIDLAGRAAVPGLADAHIHLEGLATALATVDLVGTTSYDKVIARVAVQADRQPAGTWIVGRGWDQNDWDELRFPHHRSLSEAVPRHPVVLRRIGGHALLANRAALQAAGVDGSTRPPDGGRILLDAAGDPTGVLIDAAMDLVTGHVPPDDVAVRRARMRAAVAHLHQHGITQVHDAGVGAGGLALVEAMARDGELPLRVHVMVAAGSSFLRRPASETGLPTDDLTGQGLVSVRAIKLSADGALGSRGAALLADYSDDPGNRGLVTAPYDEILSLARFALHRGWQLCTHAIGDRANRLVLDAYEAAGGGSASLPEARFRIEHAQVLHPDDIPRFARLGVIPSMQTQHLTSDMPWAEARLGPLRVRGAYAWRALLDTGVIIPGGSDAPVERVAPMAAFAAAVTRATPERHPPGGWSPGQAMTRAEALAHLTAWPARAAFREDEIGSLRPGLLADVVVLSADPLAVPDAEIASIRVDLTVFDGRVVWDRGPGREAAR